MIVSVWILASLISLAPLLGWKQAAPKGNYYVENGTAQCAFLDLPSYTVYSATGSFFTPTIVMFFVYLKIYQAFAKHRARQIYRQKVGTLFTFFTVGNIRTIPTDVVRDQVSRSLSLLEADCLPPTAGGPMSA